MEEQHGQESAALTDYRDAVRLAPDDVTYQRSVLRLLERQTGTDNERIAILTHILELEPASTAEAMRLSNLYTGPDADHQRVVMFRGLIQRAPNVVTYHDALASALAAIGDTDGAQSEYNTALKLNPQDATARTGLQKLGASAPAPPAGTLTPP